MIRDLRAIDTEYTAPMDPELGTMVATYARTLSAIERDRRKGAGGEFGSKSNEELLEMALQDPMLREALTKLGHAD